MAVSLFMRPALAFSDPIFDLEREVVADPVPLTAYQYYILTRSRLDYQFDLESPRGQFQGLLWYLQHYCPGKLPLRAPLSGRQIAWLLEPSAPYMTDRPVPRVAEAFWQNSPGSVASPYGDAAAYARFAYWWAVEQSPKWGLEHALVSDAFIAALSAGPSNFDETAANVFLRAYLAPRDLSPDVSSEAERLALYGLALCDEHGVHYSLFFPEPVLRRLAVADAGAKLAQGFGQVPADVADRLAERARRGLAYRDLHRRLRSGRVNISAASLGRDWEVLVGGAPRKASGEADRPARAAANLDVPVRVIGPVNSQSGLGQAARMSIAALRAAGVEPEIVDFYLENPAPRTKSAPGSPRTDGQFAVNILHLNAEAIPIAAAYLPERIFENAHNIGYFFWELPRAAKCHVLGLRQVDEVWVSSEFNREIYASPDGPEVIKVGMAVAPQEMARPSRESTRIRYKIDGAATVFMTTLDGYSFLKRKNPVGVLRAFRRAFPSSAESVRLVVKGHNLKKSSGLTNTGRIFDELFDLVSIDPRIILIDETLEYQDLLNLKAACDVYVSLHRSEGWGFGMIEAMQLGVPVIATGYSGNLEFCTEETAFLVPHGRTYLAPDDYIFVQPGDYWAEPDLTRAAEYMRLVHEDPALAKSKGEIARGLVNACFTPEPVGRRYVERIRTIASARRSSISGR